MLIPSVFFFPACPTCVLCQVFQWMSMERLAPNPLSPARPAVSAAHKSSLMGPTHRLRMRSFLRFTTSLSINLVFFVVLSEDCWEDRRGKGNINTGTPGDAGLT